MHPILKEVLLDIERLEPFPEVAVRVLELSLQEECGPQELVEVVRTDAGITSKVLSLANSSLVGLRVSVASIDQAAMHLGTKALVSMVMASASKSFYMGLGASTPRSNRSLWEESVANALASRIVAQRSGLAEADVAFSVGLLQNIGHIVLDRFLAIERDDILCHVDQGISILRAERMVIGMNHAQIGARLARRWGFPAVLVDAILHHHTPHLSVVDPDLCATTNLAEAITWQLLGGDEANALAYGVSGQTVNTVGLDTKEMQAVGKLVEAELVRQRDVLGLEEVPR